MTHILKIINSWAAQGIIFDFFSETLLILLNISQMLNQPAHVTTIVY